MQTLVKNRCCLFLCHIVVAVFHIGKGHTFGNHPRADVLSLHITPRDGAAVFVLFQWRAGRLYPIKPIMDRPRDPSATGPIGPLFGDAMLICLRGVDGLQTDTNA